MKHNYQDVLDQFWMWMNTVAPAPECNPHPPRGIRNAVNMINIIADGVAEEYPYYFLVFYYSEKTSQSQELCTLYGRFLIPDNSF